ncbi:cupin domain-containing protein [Hymenobacter polaris]|nr:cupin domain-containing protein [Hymenobacter polaris]
MRPDTVLRLALGLGVVGMLAALGSQAQTEHSTPSPIFTKGQPGPAANFTGHAWVQGLVGKADKYSCGAGSVQFAPGARTHWHTHPAGQILLVVEGTGHYQEKGQPLRLLHKGDVIKAPAGVEHWHGAALKSAMTHVAINPDLAAVPVIWGRAVTEAEYLGQR